MIGVAAGPPSRPLGRARANTWSFSKVRRTSEISSRLFLFFVFCLPAHLLANPPYLLLVPSTSLAISHTGSEMQTWSPVK